MNRFETSNDTISCFSLIFRFFVNAMKSLVLLMVYFDFVNGASNFARYLDVLYVAVPMFEMIGVLGVDRHLCILPLAYAALRFRRNVQVETQLGILNCKWPLLIFSSSSVSRFVPVFRILLLDLLGVR